MIREHEVLPGKNNCEHCNAYMPGPESTCVWRKGEPPRMPTRLAPGPGHAACEDDAIHAYIQELRKRQLEAWNPETPPDIGDCC